MTEPRGEAWDLGGPGWGGVGRNTAALQWNYRWLPQRFAPSAASSGLFDILAVFYHSFTAGLVCCQGNSYRFEPGWKRPQEEIC